MFENDITGSWHPAGFHGHFRSKSRNDIDTLYRHGAKPQPPQLFYKRSEVRSDNHNFSKHDNRNTHASGMGDLEMHFSMGLGKRKPGAKSQHYKSTSSLLHWHNDNNSPTPSPIRQQRNQWQNQTSYLQSYKTINKDSQPKNVVTQEPIHSRRNPALRRKLLSARMSERNPIAPPLLAWGPIDGKSTENFKPCVGDSSRRIIHRTPPQRIVETNTSNERVVRYPRVKSAF